MKYNINYTIDESKFKEIEFKGHKFLILKNSIHKDKNKDFYNMGYVNHSGNSSNRPETIYNDIKKYINNDDFILELGSGEGDFAFNLFLNHKNNIRYLGIDIVSDLIEVSKLNVPSYKFKKFDLNDKLVITDDKVDVVIALGCGHPKNVFTWTNMKKIYNPLYIILETRDSGSDYYNSVFPAYHELLKNDYELIETINYNFDVGFNSKRKLVVYKRKIS